LDGVLCERWVETATSEPALGHHCSRVLSHAFYSTHDEAVHATGARHRLDRQFDKRLSRHALALEEIVAELTAAFVLADPGLTCRPREKSCRLCELLAGLMASSPLGDPARQIGGGVAARIMSHAQVRA
jgi:hypothetical protein